MSQSFQIVTPEFTLECPKSIFDKMNKALWPEDYERHGFDIERCGSELYLFAPELGNPDNLPDDFLELFAYVLILNDRLFMEFGAAYYESKCRPGTSGGFRFRIHNDASIEYESAHYFVSDKEKNQGDQDGI